MGLLRKIRNYLAQAAYGFADRMAAERAAFTEDTTPLVDEEARIKYWNTLPVTKQKDLDLEKPNKDLRLEVYLGGDPNESHEGSRFFGASLIVDAGLVVGKEVARSVITFYTEQSLRCWAETYDADVASDIPAYLSHANDKGIPVIIGGQLITREGENPEIKFEYIQMQGFKGSLEECIITAERKPGNGKNSKKQVLKK